MTKLEQLEEDLETLSWCIRELKDLYDSACYRIRRLSDVYVCNEELIKLRKQIGALIKDIADFSLKYGEVQYSISELKSKENNENK